MAGIIDWRIAELERLNVDIRLNTYADAQAILAERPQVVVVATGGIPDTEWLEGGHLCVSVWDVLTGTTPSKDEVLVYDGTGRQAALSCAVQLASRGKSVFVSTPDEALAVEMPYPDQASFRKRIAELGIRSAVDVRLIKVVRQGAGLIARFRNEFTGAETEMVAQQIIIENGTLPVDELYQDLIPQSANLGVTNIEFLLGQESEGSADLQQSGFTLHRIGDVVASRDIYSSIHEAYRLCSKL